MAALLIEEGSFVVIVIPFSFWLIAAYEILSTIRTCKESVVCVDEGLTIPSMVNPRRSYSLI